MKNKTYDQIGIIAMDEANALNIFTEGEWNKEYCNFNDYSLLDRLDMLRGMSTYIPYHLYLFDCRKSFANPKIYLLF